MTIQEYISSGIIESYVMGMASETEAAEFETLCRQHPELQQARTEFEASLEKKAFHNAIQPAPHLKEKIWNAIQRDNIIREHISSGIIESYVMGVASKTEATEFESLCQQYPELQQARDEFEDSLEKKAISNTVQPPSYLKDRIWKAIQEDMKETGKVVDMNSNKAPVKTIFRLKWVAAACILLMLVLAVIAYNNYNRNKKLQEEIIASKKRIDQIDQQNQKMEDQLKRNSELRQVKVITPEQIVPASINVFWDSTNTDVYLIIKDLSPLPPGQRYQIWSIEKGDYIDKGLFSAPVDAGERLILKLNGARNADSFAITIDKGEMRQGQ